MAFIALIFTKSQTLNRITHSFLEPNFTQIGQYICEVRMEIDFCPLVKYDYSCFHETHNFGTALCMDILRQISPKSQ